MGKLGPKVPWPRSGDKQAAKLGSELGAGGSSYLVLALPLRKAVTLLSFRPVGCQAHSQTTSPICYEAELLAMFTGVEIETQMRGR